MLTLHSDRGAPMTSKCTAQLLADLGVTRSLSRPQVSDDNPFSEAQFKTLKYHPGFPGRFPDIAAATDFCRSFFPGYNSEHRHAGIAMLTPDDVHHGRARAVLARRERTLEAAWGQSPGTLRSRNPETQPASQTGLDQPARIDNRRNCSVNRNRQCLKVVDRFRFEKFRKNTRKERFLNDMESIIPWRELSAVIEPFYPNPKGAGRRPVGIERMLRIHFLQHWFNLSDPAAEEAHYDSRAMRRFVGIDLSREPVSDETTICKFRHLMEKHNLGGRLFELVNEYLSENGLKVSRGTIMGVSIIDAPSSTKNKKKQRDSEMHQTRKGQQWYFGMKAHIGVDSRTKLIHSAVTTSANVHDSKVLLALLHGDETRVWGDSAYSGQKAAISRAAPAAKDFTQAKGSRHRKLTEVERLKNRNKSRVRAKVEHPFLILKRRFGFDKVRYRGLKKNRHRLIVACALSNLVMAKPVLLKRRRLVMKGTCA